jgi:NAD(P)-dependent dehydrogenase (short-subunit alcohol dehydrogenase family)
MISAVVTGAAMGIGRSVAQRLVEEGATVVAVDRNADALARTAAELGDRVVPMEGDIAAWATHERAAELAEEHGELAWWVNNAGVDISSSAHDATEQHIEDGLRVLLAGPMFGGAVAVRHMLARRSGSLVNISSIQGVAAFPGYYVYASAKAGVLMATKSIAVDYGPFGIRCNAVLPGAIETPMTYASLPPDLDRDEALRQEGELAPMRRIGQAAEIADVVAFLLSDRSSYMNGAEVTVDGGARARCFAYPPLPLS